MLLDCDKWNSEEVDMVKIWILYFFSFTKKNDNTFYLASKEKRINGKSEYSEGIKKE